MSCYSQYDQDLWEITNLIKSHLLMSPVSSRLMRCGKIAQYYYLITDYTLLSERLPETVITCRCQDGFGGDILCP